MIIETTDRQATGANRETVQPMETLTLTAVSLKESAFLRRLSQAIERNDIHNEEEAINEFRSMLFQCNFINKKE